MSLNYGILNNVSRTWTYRYNSFGQVLIATGPRTDLYSIRTYNYYSCTSGAQCGQFQGVTDEVGHVTSYNTYNAYGKPLTITDPNNAVTTLTYDSRQRLTSWNTGDETTSLVYWPTGLLKQVTLPDGSYMVYTYDGAHRLTRVTDQLGNYVAYTLDAMGNRVAENTYDASGVVHRTHSRVINALNQVYQEINAAGTSAVTTTFAYDGNGNQVSINAPLSRNTAQAYDALNRLSQITDPVSGVTRFAYDANDHLASVTDPRSLNTSYSYDGFGDLVQQISPDTGSITNTYDHAGNLIQSTDARGATATYTYDAANRVNSAAYSMNGSSDQRILYTYDTGSPQSEGHLTGASDANHSMTWSYDALGRVISKSQSMAGTTLSANYVYSSGDMRRLITPSGATVAYTYNSNHQITDIAVNGTAVVDNVTYEPLGAVNGWSWGGPGTRIYAYNGDGNIAEIIQNLPFSSTTRTYTFDNASRVAAISDTATGASSWTYGYDPLDRITSASSSTLSRGWTYDANGNRLSETGSSPSSYAISPSSNQITSITGALARAYTYDAGGHTTSYSGVSATYNDAGRLQTVASNGLTETLVYNALGQMIKTSGGAAGTVLYFYDEQGHLLGEYDGFGNLIEETIWLGDIPVATFRPNNSIYFIYADHLNTPLQISRPIDSATVWLWDKDPFGTTTANQNPSGLGTFVYNLRFPGQVFDSQAGLHYNYFRDYDPGSGKYIESDPIGLRGGINTYAYVGGNPVIESDADGLEAVSYMMHHPLLPPAPPPPGVSPAVKKILCKLINYCQGDMNCVFHEINSDRKNSWSDPDLRQAENFATAASDYAYQDPQYEGPVHSPFGVYFYQYDWKPLKHAFGYNTTPVSDAAYSAGMAGLDLYHKGAPAALQWCHDCGNR